MKKSVFTLLAIATAVFTMSSCSKDDAGSNAVNTSVAQQTTQTTQGTQTPSSQAKQGDVYVAQFLLSENLLNYGTFDITVTDGTETKTIDLKNEGQKVTITAKASNDSTVTLSYYKYTFVKKSSKKLSFKTTYTANDAAKQLTENDQITAGFGFQAELTEDGKAKSDVQPRIFPDIDGDKIMKLGDYVANGMTK